MLEIGAVKAVWEAGSPVVFLAGVVVLWRQVVAMQNRYEAVLERCIEALTRVNDHLEGHHDE